MGAYMRANGSIPPRNVAQFLSGPYKIANIHIESFAVLTNKTPVGTYRGPGRFEADFFRERLFDMAAKDLGIDPVEFRRRNLPASADMPYPLATVDLPEKKEELDSGDYARALERCLQEFQYEEKKSLQGRLIEGRYHGVAVTCFIEGGAAGPRESARIVIDDAGGVSVFVGSASVGQGLETVCLQIAADALGLPMERLAHLPRLDHPREGRLRRLPLAFGGHGRHRDPDRRSESQGGNRQEDRARCPAVGDRPEKRRTAFRGRNVPQPQAHLCLRRGGGARRGGSANRAGRALDYVTVEDIGRIINPLTAAGQAVGAVVQGLGGVFLEHLQYDENGQFLTASLADYLLPSSTDFPRIRAFVTEESPSPINPLGAKGAGEGGIVPVGGVVANAVAAALAPLGAEPRSLPLSPPRVWELINRVR